MRTRPAAVYVPFLARVMCLCSLTHTSRRMCAPCCCCCCCCDLSSGAPCPVAVSRPRAGPGPRVLQRHQPAAAPAVTGASHGGALSLFWAPAGSTAHTQAPPLISLAYIKLCLGSPNRLTAGGDTRPVACVMRVMAYHHHRHPTNNCVLHLADIAQLCRMALV